MKRTSLSVHRRLTASSLLAVAGLAFPALAQSPQNGQVVAGAANIQHAGAVTNITASNNAIINWQSFNVGAGQTVRFIQPGANSRVLNRVTGPDPTRIAGSLIANGIVYVTNPGGVFVAQGALVNVGGFVAAAGSMTNAAFLNNVNQFTSVSGNVENRGTINGQSVHLVGQRVANYGAINAPNGMITMTAGSDVFIGERGGQVFARVSGAAAGGTGVTQAGTLNAPGGQVRLGAGDMYAVAIDHPGRTLARNITLQGGRSGASGGVVAVSGSLDASNHAPGQTGGTVAVLGDRVGLFGTASIDVSGDAGGGQVLLGGGRQGHGPEMNAQATYIAPEATINADAVTTGNGGSVVVWSDNVTKAFGDISVRGGALSGNGGFVETSSKHELSVAKTPDITATNGRGGFWLIDPDDLTLVAGNGNVNVNQVGNVFTSSGSGAQLGIDLVRAALGGGSTVELRTGASPDPAGGTITLTSGVDLDFDGVGNATLSLFADRRIVIDGRILDSNPGGDSLNLNLTADNDLSGTGNVLINNTISLGGGNFTVLRAIDFQNSAAIDTGGGNFTVSLATTAGKATLAADISAGTGTIQINPDVVLGADVTLSGGNVTLARKVDSDGTARALAISLTGAGTTRLFGRIGSVDELASLTISSLGNAGTTRISSTSISTTGDQTYNDDILLIADVDIGAANATFARTIDSVLGAHSLDISLGNGGVARFFGEIGGVGELSTLKVLSADNLGTIGLAGGAVSTTGTQYYLNDVVLLADTTITTSGGGDIVFGRKIDSFGSARSLALNTSSGGQTRLFGAVGSTSALSQLTTDALGSTRIFASITAGTTDFADDVILGADSTITSATSASFRGTISSDTGEGNDLIVNSPLTLFAGRVGIGAGGALGRFQTDAAGTTTFDATGIAAAIIDVGDAFVLNQSVAITGTSQTVFRSTIDSEGGEANDLTINSPICNFNGRIGDAAANSTLGTLTVQGGASTINTGVIKTAVFDFRSATTLAGNLTLDATVAATFAELNSRSGEFKSLTVNAPLTLFSGVVGGESGGSLGTITTDAGGTTTISAGAMTAGTFNFNEGVLVGTDTVLTATGAANFNFTLDSVSGAGRSITINSPVTNFRGALGTLVGGALGTVATDSQGTTTLDAPTIIATTINFADNFVIEQDAVISAAASATFGGTITSALSESNDLTLNAGQASISGAVGGVAGGELGSFLTDAPGTTTFGGTVTAGSIIFNDSVVFNGGAVTTSVDQVYNGAVTIGIDTVFSARNVTFGLSLDSASSDRAATINTSGNGATTFAGPVGSIIPLLSLTTNADGTTVLSAGEINTSGDQTYNDIVIVQGATTISGNDITFQETVDADAVGAGRTLLVNSSDGGTTIFSKAIGSVHALTSLITNSDGTTRLNGGAVTTTGTQAFNDAVTLGADTTLIGGGVAFGGTLNSDFAARSLFVQTTNSGLTQFNGAVGNTSALSTLRTNVDGSTQIFAPSIRTTGNQNYNDAITLGADCVITGQDVRFGSTIDSTALTSAAALTVNSTGNGITTFNGEVGGDTPLKSITTNGAGKTRIGANLNTNGAMSFGDSVLIYRDSVLSDSGATGISFASTIDSEGVAHALSLFINTSSNATATAPSIARIGLGANVGSTLALSSLVLGGNRSSDPTVATIASGINGSTPVSNFALTINTTGAFSMGQGQKLTVFGDLTINSGATASLGDITTLGNMTINAPDIVIRTRTGGTILTAAGSGFGSTSDPAVDYVAGGLITFSATPTLSGGFNPPSFATANASGASSNLQGFSQRASGTVSASILHVGATVLDLSATGPSNTNIATAVPPPLPPFVNGQEVTLAMNPSSKLQSQLSDVGINPKSPSVKELADYLTGRSLYDDAALDMGTLASGYTVSIERLPASVVSQVLDAYNVVFLKDGQPNAPAVRESLTAAWKDYSAAAGDKADPLGFRAYVEAVPEQAQALFYMDGLRDLLREMGNLGLSPAELRASKGVVLKAVDVPGLTAAQLEAAITATNLGVAMK